MIYRYAQENTWLGVYLIISLALAIVMAFAFIVQKCVTTPPTNRVERDRHQGEIQTFAIATLLAPLWPLMVARLFLMPVRWFFAHLFATINGKPYPGPASLPLPARFFRVGTRFGNYEVEIVTTRRNMLGIRSKATYSLPRWVHQPYARDAVRSHYWVKR